MEDTQKKEYNKTLKQHRKGAEVKEFKSSIR